MGWWQRIFGGKRESSGDGLYSGRGVLGQVVQVRARWSVVRHDGAGAVVRYGEDTAGRLCVEAESGDGEVMEYVAYYLADPVQARPVYVPSGGFCPGPHTRAPEQFDRAMATMPMVALAFATERLDVPVP